MADVIATCCYLCWKMLYEGVSDGITIVTMADGMANCWHVLADVLTILADVIATCC